MEDIIKLPIRQFTEFITRSGDIDSKYVEKDRMLEGAKAHRRIQKALLSDYASYQSEVPLSAVVEHKDFRFQLEGRADGIFNDTDDGENGMAVIDEIKTTVLPLESLKKDANMTHWAQVKCYAMIYAMQNNLESIAVQLTYYNLDTKESIYFRDVFSVQLLHEFVHKLLDLYIEWADFGQKWGTFRNASIKNTPFPFRGYRKGQRELAVAVYKMIKSKHKLYAQAPTGTGKTISALFPAIKAMGEGLVSKIFYLTAKTITRQVAAEALEMMRKQGLQIKSLIITAKEKICFLEQPQCNPEQCIYARGHYDRVNKAIFDVIENNDDITREIVEEYAKKHRVCPFELSLDLSLLCDCIICDYNYVFDPRAYLRRFFSDQGGDYVFLIDEAHNLADRAREMFSAELSKSAVYKIKKEYKNFKKVSGSLSKLNRYFIDIKKQSNEKETQEQGFLVFKEKQTEFIKLVNSFVAACETTLKENRELSEQNEFMQLYFDALNFMLISEFYDEHYVTFVDAQNGDVNIKLFCADPSQLLREAFKRGSSAVLFSATLTPLPYFKELLGGEDGDKLISLLSPYDPKKLCLLIEDRVSTTYKNREKTTPEIVRLISEFISQKTGNYIVYFPSYKYMNDVFEAFQTEYPDVNAVIQQNSMQEEQREQFLASFIANPAETYVAFCVLGGLFSEGIDLKGDRLIGAVIVGVGLPQLSVQQNIIRDYYHEKNGMGFEYAYMYPGMNKVLQAAGRVIRSEEDNGSVLLIDQRFNTRAYRELFPPHWKYFNLVKDIVNYHDFNNIFWHN